MAGRHKKEDREARENAMRKIFRDIPGISSVHANDLFKNIWGTKMRTKRILEIKKEVNGILVAETDVLLNEVLGLLPVSDQTLIEQFPRQPPVDNEHVAAGCEQFSAETIAAAQARVLAVPTVLSPLPTEPATPLPLPEDGPSPYDNCQHDSPNKIADYHDGGKIKGKRASKMNGEVFEQWYCEDCKASWEVSAEDEDLQNEAVEEDKPKEKDPDDPFNFLG